MTTAAIAQEPTDFSLVLGGPLYHIFMRAHLSGPVLELLGRRVLVITLFAWLPLLLLSTFEVHLFGSQNLSFLRDIESHVRLLLALPLLILAELVVHRRIGPVVKRFVERGVVTAEDTPKFSAAIEAATRARNSLWLECGLIVFVLTVGHWIWRQGAALGATSWYATPDRTGIHLTLAGYWFCFVSIPLFQFILLRWYLRLAIWFQLLWRVSRLNLRLLPTHPDRAGGIGFLGGSSYAFAPILFAQGALMAGLIASRILYQGESLMSFKLSLVTLVGFFVLVILGPLTVFSPLLEHAKRRGLHEYGTLATVYVGDFDEKWVRGGAKREESLRTADIQSLADLANSYAVVREMRLVPFALTDVARLAIATAVPALPLLLTIMPLEELVTRLLKTIF
jgi:hypothetical protein